MFFYSIPSTSCLTHASSVMSQLSNDFAGPSESHTDESSLHYHRCWWSWCRHNFYSRNELLDHVKAEHVAKARPVPIAKVSALQKPEHGNWESLDVSQSLLLLPSSSLVQPENQAQEGGHCTVVMLHQTLGPSMNVLGSSANPHDCITSSLPSPPASTTHEDPCTPVCVADLQKDTDPPLVPPHRVISPQMSNAPFTPLPKRNIFDIQNSTPSFASLSSQPNSPCKPTYDIPDSPCFDVLVAEALKEAMPVVPKLDELDEDGLSPSEDSSQEFVFNHLTQGIDDDEDGDIQEAASENGGDLMVVDSPSAIAIQPISRHNQPGTNSPASQANPKQNPSVLTLLQIQPPTPEFIPQALPTSPSYLHTPTLPFTTPVARQSWYQPRRRRSSKKMSGSEVSAGQASPAASPLVKLTTPATPPLPAKFLPAAVQAGSQSDGQLFYQREENWTGTDSSSQMSSYPPLQTQASYRSQSMSPD